MPVLDHARPFYKVEFYDPESSELRSAFSPNVFLDNERPSGENTISQDIYISNITVKSKLDASVNESELEIRHGVGGELPLDINYKVKIYFGFYDQDKSQGPDFSLAFIGYVTGIKNGFEKSIITCKSKMNKITKKKTKKTFSRMMGLNELIREFAINLGGLEEAQNGISDPGISKQPGFGVSGKLPIIDHVKKMAKHSALDVFMDVFDKFHARPWDTSQLQETSNQDIPWISGRNRDESQNTNFYKHKIIFDQTLVEANFGQMESKYSGVEVVSFVPFSGEQVDTIDPVKVVHPQSGSNDSTRPLDRHKISHVTREDAEKIAENIHKFNSGKVRGSVKLFGAPQIRIGDGVKFTAEDIEQLPFSNIQFDTEGSQHGIADILFQVTEVQHKFDTVDGYTTKIGLVDKPATVGTARAGAAGAGAAGAGAGITAEGAEFTGVGEAGAISELPIEITNASWDKEEARQGDKLTLTADVEGAPDGTQGEIEIFEHDVDGTHDVIDKFPVVVRNNKIETTWEYQYHADTDEIPTPEELERYGREYNPPEYFFVVRVGRADDTSGILNFKDFIEIELRDENEEIIPNQKYILYLPDGQERRGSVDENGYGIEENLPPGKIKIKFLDINEEE